MYSYARRTYVNTFITKRIRIHIHFDGGANKHIDIITRVHKYIPYTKKVLRHINFTKKANSHIPFSSGCPTDIPITISLQNHIHFNLITQSYYYNSLSKIFLLLEWSINIFNKNQGQKTNSYNLQPNRYEGIIEEKR